MSVIDLFSGIGGLSDDLSHFESKLTSDIAEVEEQRPGRNKNTQINHSYINSGEYKRKIDSISNDSDLSRLLYKLAKEMLVHRSGTKYEDMYWIDLDTLEIIAKEIDCDEEKLIKYSAATQKAIVEYENILTIHTHPDSFPPSIGDFNSNYEHQYTVGIVLGHNGKIFLYSANESINEDYYMLVVERFIKNGYSEDESLLLAIDELKKNFDISFKEVTDHGSI